MFDNDLPKMKKYEELLMKFSDYNRAQMVARALHNHFNVEFKEQYEVRKLSFITQSHNGKARLFVGASRPLDVVDITVSKGLAEKYNETLKPFFGKGK